MIKCNYYDIYIYIYIYIYEKEYFRHFDQVMSAFKTYEDENIRDIFKEALGYEINEKLLYGKKLKNSLMSIRQDVSVIESEVDYTVWCDVAFMFDIDELKGLLNGN